jgi:hypothetical protein
MALATEKIIEMLTEAASRYHDGQCINTLSAFCEGAAFALAIAREYGKPTAKTTEAVAAMALRAKKGWLRISACRGERSR